MGAFSFIDKTALMLTKNDAMIDHFLGLIAAKIEINMKTGGEVPLLPKSTKWAQRGALRASIRSSKVNKGHYEVTVGENSPAGSYAAAQEAGMTRGYPMVNYSTPGTGAHFFQHAIDKANAKTSEYAIAARNAAGIGGVI